MISLGSLWLAHKSWRASEVQAQAELFQERYQIFSAAKNFLRPWFRNGTPDLSQLGEFTEAWEKSQFLFEQEATDFLRQLWLDAVSAAHDREIIAGTAEGNRDQAIERSYQLALKYLAGTADEPSTLVNAFQSMKFNHKRRWNLGVRLCSINGTKKARR
jgi:hypothetical protein